MSTEPLPPSPPSENGSADSADSSSSESAAVHNPSPTRSRMSTPISSPTRHGQQDGQLAHLASPIQMASPSSRRSARSPSTAFPAPAQINPLPPLSHPPLMAQALSPSHGAPDVSVSVANLVSRFNTLKVADTDEDAAAKQAKALKKLDAALRRAEIAREEAESEVRGLRKETKGLRALAEERERETDAVRTRCEDFEKKYEKAKLHFRAQRTKHDDQLRRAQKEFMEREKLHWRQQAAVEEEVNWERKLRMDAMELVSFMEVERRLMIRELDEVKKTKVAAAVAAAAAAARRKSVDVERADSAVDESMIDLNAQHANEEKARHAESGSVHEDQEMLQDTAAEEGGSPPLNLKPTETEDPLKALEITPEPDVAQPVDENEDVTPGDNSNDLSSPPKKTYTVPINFGDDDDEEAAAAAGGEHGNEARDEDKENAAPTTSSFHNSHPSSFSYSTPARSISSLSHYGPNVRTPATIATCTAAATTTSNAHPGTNPVPQWRRDVVDAANDNKDGAGKQWDIPGVLAAADIDRKAALAAIQYRRGRARSFAASAGAGGAGGCGGGLRTPSARRVVTPARGGAGDERRDVSAPPLMTMSVGRKGGRA